MRTRRGISLVEVLTVMSGFTVMLTMTAALLHRSMQSQAETRYFFDSERTAWRLCRQFRDDVHAAGSATIEDDASEEGVFLRLPLRGEEMVQYERSGGKIARILLRGEQRVSQEEYQLSPRMELQLREEGSPRRLVLTIVTKAGPPLVQLGKPAASLRELPVNLSVEAVLSRDWRFTASAATAEAGE
jgi:type II secretory pathway component PulJ